MCCPISCKACIKAVESTSVKKATLQRLFGIIGRQPYMARHNRKHGQIEEPTACPPPRPAGTYRGGSFVARSPQGCAGELPTLADEHCLLAQLLSGHLAVFASEDEAHRTGPEHGRTPRQQQLRNGVLPSAEKP